MLGKHNPQIFEEIKSLILNFKGDMTYDPGGPSSHYIAEEFIKKNNLRSRFPTVRSMVVRYLNVLIKQNIIEKYCIGQHIGYRFKTNKTQKESVPLINNIPDDIKVKLDEINRKLDLMIHAMTIPGLVIKQKLEESQS